MTLIQVYGRVLSFLGEEKRLAWLLAAGNLLLAVAQFAEPVLFGRIVDTLTKAAGASGASGASGSWGGLAPLMAAWVGFGFFIIAASTWVALHADRLSHRRRQAAITTYFEHVLQLPLAFHGTTHSGRLLKVMLQGTDGLWNLWIAFFREHFAAFISVLVLMPLSLFINWQMALLLIVLCVVFAALTGLVVSKTHELQSSVEDHYSALAERASDTLGNVALVQSYARIEAEVAGMRNLTTQLLAAQIPVLSWWALVAVATRASTTLTILSIFVLGTWLNLQGKATVGEIVMFVNFATMLIHRLEQVVSFSNAVFMQAPRLREFFEVLDSEPAVRDRPDAVDPGRVRGLVEFKGVSFSYDGKRSAVADLTFTALPGETIALVGSTGAGKSTAIALLHRVFDPQSGSILIDGMDIRGLKLTALRRNIGVVFQEALVLNRSIAENMCVGKSDATEAEMRQAAERAQALDFIERNPQGFEALVGERGRSLSGGERQRLSIARALLKDPPILILDEATSALDAATEAKVQAALDEVMKNRTTFVIAHRLATVRNATRILVFESGHVVETGSFNELVALGGVFAQLARAQFMVKEQPTEALAAPATGIADT